MPKFLSNPNLKFILFGGKGGSGKTTSACATALHFHKTYPEKRILVMSTDPAHSLGDSFDLEIGNKITPILENVWGLEIDAQELYEEYKDKHGEAIKKIAERGTIFDKEDVEAFLTKTLPGLDEVMAIIRIANFLRTEEFDLVILDTAPTGHTQVLLSLPEQMSRFVDIAGLMMEKYRYVFRSMVGRYKRDICDDYLESQREDVRRVRQALTNTTTTEFVPVTIPEPMSIYEVEKLIQTLIGEQISVKSIIVNRVTEEERCPFCSARRKEAEKYLPEMEEKFSPYNLIRMPLFPQEIRGIDRLTEYAQILFGEVEYKPSRAKVKLPEAISLPKGTLSDLLRKEELNFLIFGGKGGVGKTSVAAANAIYLARNRPEKKFFTFSTDPAHSLSESFGQTVGDKITPISGLENLHALEINGVKLLEDLKQVYREEIEEVFRKFSAGSGVDIVFDRDIIERLIDVIPPGVEELMALREVMELRKEEKYDLYIMDSAASGHLIRFLQLPGLFRDWLRTTFRMLTKYRGIVKLTRPTEILLDLSRSIREILATLADPHKTEFVMIAIPEGMGVAEMGDLFSSTAELKIPSSHTVINMIIPPSDCDFCAAKRENQQRYIEKITEQLKGKTVIPVPLLPYETRGLDSLNELAGIMYGG